ncbi:hypothetical protein HF086_016272 [Spodoptera exigua]|uniref:Uncharacterized protein n=1 Tax=Spodoptera exigua TaxID=7107 RepID=A0A922SQ31_SPOEX|nr:hypothetical protein HF086_016272 [Spodoptera exigua]
MFAGIDEEFMPWLVDEVSKEIESIITSRDVITEIVRDVVEARAELYRAAGERAAERTEPAESMTPPSQAEPAPPEEERESATCRHRPRPRCHSRHLARAPHPLRSRVDPPLLLPSYHSHLLNQSVKQTSILT